MPAVVTVYSADGGPERYDAVFLACHSDQALAMLDVPTATEREVLGAIKYQTNEAVLHTDISVLPRRKRCWAAWNYHVPQDDTDHVAVTYNMNILQGIRSRRTYCVTLNDTRSLAPEHVIRRINYEHPVFTKETIVAQERQEEVNRGNTFFCGAYWRNGFHEDGVVSAIRAVSHFREQMRHEQLHIRRAS